MRTNRLTLSSLNEIRQDYESGKWNLTYEQEDVHMNVEATLIKKIGMDLGGRMHTCRSRNDQVPVDSKLYCRKRLIELRDLVIKATEAFLKRAPNFLESVAVGYTHVQHAQPISVAFWLTNYSSALLRDLERLKNAYDRTDSNPLGAGALSGTSFDIDRALTSDLLGFQRIHEHSLDATGNRDFLLETTSAAAILYSTLSRLGEEFVLWSSYEFRTITLDDGFAMGSSMMPNKKNPGALELLRGRSGRVNGLNVAAFDMMKGLPSGYNRDFHEDKEILVALFDLVTRAVEIVPVLIDTTTINTARMAELIGGNFSTATELANYLVARHNVPFRQAHHVVGSLVGELSRAGKNFNNLNECYAHLKQHGINAPDSEVKAVLDPTQVMKSYNSLGGTGPQAVKAVIDKSNKELERHKRVLADDLTRVANARQATLAIVEKNASFESTEDIRATVKANRPSSLLK